MKDIQKYCIPVTTTLRESLKRLNDLSSDLLTLLLVDEEERLQATLTDGDIRRALIHGATLEDPAIKAACKSPFVLRSEEYDPETLQTIRHRKLTLIPLIDEKGKIRRIYDFRNLQCILPLDVVIMAGGRGERLRPLTDTRPKPLLPLGDKAIVEHNVDRLAECGIRRITFSIRYLGEQIREYFKDGSEKGIHIDYIEETSPLGTMGAVTLAAPFSKDTVLVMNSDLFTNINFEEFYLHFLRSKADMSVASIPYNVSIPYAVMKTEEGRITEFQEKPTYTYYSNAGIYLIKRSLLNEIPYGERYDATDLMQHLIDTGRKVTPFPIVGYWIDIGKPEDYKKAQEFIKYI